MAEHSVVFKKAPDLVTRKVGGEAVIVPVRNRVGDLESVFTLNDVALRIWELVDGRSSVDDIAAAVVTEYDVDAATAAADARELFSRLAEAKLVEEVAG